jgi:hypothetical protein
MPPSSAFQACVPSLLWGALEGSIGRVSTMTEDTGKAIGTINNATKSLADDAVRLRGATPSLIQRLQAA